MHPFVRSAALALFVTLSFHAVAQQPAATPIRVRGEIVAIDADTIKVHRNSGETVSIRLAPDVRLNAAANVPLNDIKAGSYLGITSSPAPGGHLRARSVQVFPESARGTGEGHRDWDIAPDAKMTNATVDAVVQSANGRQLTMSYKGGTQVIEVPEGAPVFTPVSATRADLVVGRKVFVLAVPVEGGTFTTSRLFVEKDGVAPPL